jgi:hypothetical protein
MPRVLVEISTKSATLPAGKVFMHRYVTVAPRLSPDAAASQSVVTKTTTATFADVAPGAYVVTVQDVATDESLLGTAITAPLDIGAAPPPGGVYAASGGLSFQVAA